MRKVLKPPKRSYVRVFAPDLSGGMNGFTDSRVLPFSVSAEAYNVSVESGALENGYGVLDTKVPQRLHKLFYYKIYNDESQSSGGYYLAHDGINGKIYGWSDDIADRREVEGVTFAAAPLGVNYRLYGEDVFLLCGEEGMAVVDSSLRAVTVSTAPSITSVAMHNERMFVTIGGRRNAVWFSDDLDPTNWNPELDEGGFIELEGEHGRLNKAVAFGGYVYVFCDYGIVRLTAFGAQSDFSVTNLFVSSGRIYADTVAVCGDRILFLAGDGLYSFDGLTATRIAKHLDGVISVEDSPTGCYCGGKYWLAALAADDTDGTKLLVAVDPRSTSTCVCRGIEADVFSPIVNTDGETLYVHTPRFSMGKVERGPAYYGVGLKKIWRSGMTDLGYPNRRKLVTEVCIDTKYPCTLTVSTERKSKSFDIDGKQEVQRKRVNIVGTKVRLEIETRGDISVARPTIVFTSVS